MDLNAEMPTRGKQARGAVQPERLSPGTTAIGRCDSPLSREVNRERAAEMTAPNGHTIRNNEDGIRRPEQGLTKTDPRRREAPSDNRL